MSPSLLFHLGGELISVFQVSTTFVAAAVVLFFVPAHNLRMARALIAFLRLRHIGLTSCDVYCDVIVMWLARACIAGGFPFLESLLFQGDGWAFGCLEGHEVRWQPRASQGFVLQW